MGLPESMASTLGVQMNSTAPKKEPLKSWGELNREAHMRSLREARNIMLNAPRRTHEPVPQMERMIL